MSDDLLLDLRATGTAGRSLVMGVLNVTPDSFSDGGRFADPDAAVAHGVELVEQGADVVDVGGESTRPGAVRVSADAELDRTLPVVRALAAEGVTVSIDTMHAVVAARAVEAGAVLVNDVSGGLADPAMLPTVADLGVPYVAMHWRGHSDRMDELAVYSDVVAEVRAELAARLDAAVAAGIDPGRVVLDPGIGFAKTAAHSWAVLADLEAFLSLGRPVLVGVSRKRFLGTLLGGGPAVAAEERDLVTSVLSGICARDGVWAVRVHDAAGGRQAVEVAAALRRAAPDRAADGAAKEVSG